MIDYLHKFQRHVTLFKSLKKNKLENKMLHE